MSWAIRYYDMCCSLLQIYVSQYGSVIYHKMKIRLPGFLQKQTSIPLRLWFLLLAPLFTLMIFIPLLVHPDVSDSFDELIHGEAEKHPIMFATIREENQGAEPINRFSGDRGDGVKFGVCQMSFEPLKPLQELSESVPFYVPADRKTLTEIQDLEDKQFDALLRATTKQFDGKIIVYVHGYNIGFEKACRRAAIFQHATNTRGQLVLFSWPADGNALNYIRDEADLEWSVGYLAEFLLDLSKKFPGAKINLVGHSLGGRGMAKALANIAQRSNKGPIFNDLILLAPDIDSGLFEQLFPSIRTVVRHASLYVSDKDNALKVSNQLHGYPRLGEAGEYLTILKGLDTIDVTDSGGISASGHLYHLHNSFVLQDIKKVLHSANSDEIRKHRIKQSSRDKMYWKIVK